MVFRKRCENGVVLWKGKLIFSLHTCLLLQMRYTKKGSQKLLSQKFIKFGFMDRRQLYLLKFIHFICKRMDRMFIDSKAAVSVVENELAPVLCCYSDDLCIQNSTKGFGNKRAQKIVRQEKKEAIACS